MQGFEPVTAPVEHSRYGTAEHEVCLGLRPEGEVLVDESVPRFWEVFLEVYEPLPRQGPGNRVCAEKALGLCRQLPQAPAVLDLGCGVGGQTLHLAELMPSALITAMDSHAPSIERLCAAAAQRGLAERVRPLVGDMAHPGLPPGSFDLSWSEGALYNIGRRSTLAAVMPAPKVRDSGDVGHLGGWPTPRRAPTDGVPRARGWTR